MLDLRSFLQHLIFPHAYVWFIVSISRSISNFNPISSPHILFAGHRQLIDGFSSESFSPISFPAAYTPILDFIQLLIFV